MWKSLCKCGKLLIFYIDNIVFVVYNRGMYEIFDGNGNSVDLVELEVLELFKKGGMIKPDYKIFNTITGERIK